MDVKQTLKKLTLIIVGILLIPIVVGIAYAASTLIRNDPAEDVTGDPITFVSPSPSPTLAPTASPTPSPSPNIPTAIHLQSNNTAPFYIGDSLHLVAVLDKPVAGINVTLYNSEVPKASALTDDEGKVVWDRAPTLHYDYSVTFEQP